MFFQAESKGLFRQLRESGLTQDDRDFLRNIRVGQSQKNPFLTNFKFLDIPAPPREVSTEMRQKHKEYQVALREFKCFLKSLTGLIDDYCNNNQEHRELKSDLIALEWRMRQWVDLLEGWFQSSSPRSSAGSPSPRPRSS